MGCGSHHPDHPDWLCMSTDADPLHPWCIAQWFPPDGGQPRSESWANPAYYSRAQLQSQRQQALEVTQRCLVKTREALSAPDLDHTTPYNWGAVRGKLYQLAILAKHEDVPYNGNGFSELTYFSLDPKSLEDATIATVLWAWDEHMQHGRTVTAHMWRQAFSGDVPVFGESQDEPDRRYRAMRKYVRRYPATGFGSFGYKDGQDRHRVHNLIAPINGSGQVIVTGLPPETVQRWTQIIIRSIAAEKRAAIYQAKKEAKKARQLSG